MANSNHYDIAIIGAGPAGVQAAIHSATRKATVVVFGKVENSSLQKAKVVNYWGIEGVVSGQKLLETGRDQALQLSTTFIEEDVVHVSKEGVAFSIVTESGMRICANALILAPGITRNKLRVKREDDFEGRGLSYCVDCDCRFYEGKDVAVIGNRSAAATGALTLLKYARQVSLICSQLDISAHLETQLRQSGVMLVEGTWIDSILGVEQLEAVTLRNGETLKVDGLFVELGAKGAMELVANLGVEFDAETFSLIKVNNLQETNIAGLYAAGDITGKPWQVAKAVGEGCIAGLEAARYVKELSSNV